MEYACTSNEPQQKSQSQTITISLQNRFGSRDSESNATRPAPRLAFPELITGPHRGRDGRAEEQE